MYPMSRCCSALTMALGLTIGILALLSGHPVGAAQSDNGKRLDAPVEQAWVSAIGNDQAARLKRMLEQYEPAQLLSMSADNGKSALMVAAKVGDMSLLETLVDAGARIDETTQTNGTAFMFAVLGNQRAIAEWLVNQGADIHVIGSNGWSALTIAAAKGYVDLLQWLVAEKADAQLRDVYRFTPLMRAVENNHEEVVSLLLALPATDVDVQDEFGNTSLHHAVSAGNASMVKLLLENKADLSIRNRNGTRAEMLADDKPAIQALFR